MLRGIVSADGRILNDPEPFIAVPKLADSSVNFVLQAWVNSADYWGVYFDTIETVKKAFDRQGLSIPYPQQDLHLSQLCGDYLSSGAGGPACSMSYLQNA